MGALLSRSLIQLASVAFLAGNATAQRDVTQDGRYHAVAWIQNAAEYRLAVRQAYRLAAIQLERGLADPTWTADRRQHEQGGIENKPPAVILDVDQSVLDNSAFDARCIVDGTTFSTAAWNAWVGEQQATALPGALPFVKHAEGRGAKIFFITNRTDDIKRPTIRNLIELGFPATADTVLTRNDEDGRPGDKASRRAMVAAGHRVVLIIGDDMNDFCSGMRGEDGARRNARGARLEKLLGERWVLLPNPVYGGWEKALGDRRAALRTLRDSDISDSRSPGTGR